VDAVSGKAPGLHASGRHFYADAAFDRVQKIKISDFQKKTATKYAIHPTLITTYELANNAIHESSSGIPRMINRVCEKSLIYAFQQGKRLIDEHIVLYVVEHEMLESKT